VIGTTLRTYEDRQTCAAELIARTLEAGAPDNVTVIVCDVVTD
jgi:protein phosphatase